MSFPASDLKHYSIIFRKNIGDGQYQYTLMDGKNQSATVTLDGAQGRDDPLKGLYEARMRLNRDQTEIIGLEFNGICVIKRI